jgi:hypothetical protein
MASRADGPESVGSIDGERVDTIRRSRRRKIRRHRCSTKRHLRGFCLCLITDRQELVSRFLERP